MAREMEVWGYLAMIPRGWPGLVASPNGNLQRRVVVAASSRAAAFYAMTTAGIWTSRSEFNRNACPTGNDAETAAALSQPGTVFYALTDMGREYLSAPTKES